MPTANSAIQGAIINAYQTDEYCSGNRNIDRSESLAEYAAATPGLALRYQHAGCRGKPGLALVVQSDGADFGHLLISFSRRLSVLPAFARRKLVMTVACTVAGPVSSCWREPKKLAWMLYWPGQSRRRQYSSGP